MLSVGFVNFAFMLTDSSHRLSNLHVLLVEVRSHILQDGSNVCARKSESTSRVASHCDDDFSKGVSFLQIPDSGRDLTQRVTPVYHRGYFSRLK